MGLPVLATNVGFSLDPAVDNTPAWNAAVAAGGPDWLIFTGAFDFKTKPNPINRPMLIEGVPGINAATLCRNYVASGLTDPFIDCRSTSTFKRLALRCDQGLNTGIGISLNGLAASDSNVKDSYITALPGCSWAVPVAVQSSDPLGIRGCHLSNMEIFAAGTHLLWGVNVRGLSLVDVNCYPAGGSVKHATIQQSGVHRSASVIWLTRYLETLYVYNTDGLKLFRLNPVTVIPSGSTGISQI